MPDNIKYYSAATVLIAILMVAMSIHVIGYSGFDKKQKAWFIATFAAIVFCAGAEYALHCGFYDPKYRVILSLLTVLQFSIAPCLAMLFAGALGLKHQFKIVLGTFGVCVLIGIICVPFGWVFYIGNQGYHRGPYFLVYEITYIASLAYIIGTLYIVGKKFNHRDVGTIIMVLVILAAGIIPMSIWQLHVAYISVGMSACICYVYYNDLVQQDTNSLLVEKQQKISEMQVQITGRLANLIESRDTETGQHVTRTSAYVKNLAQDCVAHGVYIDIIDDKYIDNLFNLAPLHDVGKIFISDKILRKPARLTPEEYEEIKKHASLGGGVVRQIMNGIAEEEQIEFAVDIATGHHERWDGSGYPNNLKGDDIPLSARIMAIADVFDALVSKRCYKDPFPIDEAFKIIKEESGSHFDPKLVNVFLAHKEKYQEINESIVDK